MLSRLRSALAARLAPRQFPHLVTLRASRRTLCFRVYSPVERQRVANYGGERAIWRRFLAQIRPSDLLYDIGASVGLYALAAATIARQVVAFEPDPENRTRLAENIALSGLNNLTLVPWAASDAPASAILYSDGAAGYAPSLARQSREGAPSGEIRVLTQAIDLALAAGELPLPDLLKIDIEGAEGRCLAGCRQLLAGAFGPPPRAILLEIHPEFLPAFGDSASSVVAQLAAAGYQPAWSSGRSAQTISWYRRIERRKA